MHALMSARERAALCMDPCECNCTAMSPIILCSCSWRREPRGIGPGRTLTGCPHTRPRALGGLMELCCTLKRTRATQVRAGKHPLSAQGFTELITMMQNETRVLFYSWFSVPLHSCSSLFPPLFVF